MNNALRIPTCLHTSPCLDIPSRSCKAFVVSFKSLSIKSNLRLVLLVSKAGGGRPDVGLIKYADTGRFLSAELRSFPVELFTAKVIKGALKENVELAPECWINTWETAK